MFWASFFAKFYSDIDDDKEIRLFEEQRKLANEKIKLDTSIL